MKSYINIIFIFIICIPLGLLSQNNALEYVKGDINEIANQDSIIPSSLDTHQLLLALDTLPKSLDSTLITQKEKKTIKIAKDAVKQDITYAAKDSNWIDVKMKEIHLYGTAHVEYEKIKISAGYMVINFENNTAKAYSVKNSKGKYIDAPSFEDGETKAGFRELAYNFESKKAIVSELSTSEGEFYLIGQKSKYISKDNDTIYHEDVFYNKNAIITTCNHSPPHFGIRTSKLKFIPDRLAIIGPSQLVIAGIPTPIVLPFGFFPLVSGASSGLIFPRSWEQDPNKGFGLRDVGYYFPISDYMDARVTGDIYTRGTVGLRVSTNYKKRYKYSGTFNIGYLNLLSENAQGKVLSSKAYTFQLSHNQDSKAHPYRTVSGTINFSTNKYDKVAYNDANSVLNNKTNSNFSFGYRWPDSPFKINVGLSHTQDQQSRKVSLTLPDASLNMNTLYPFKRKNQSGGEKWFEQISLGYGAKLKSFVNTTDSTFFTSQTLKDLQTGFSHNATLSTSARVLKYINISPTINYNEIYFLKTVEKTLDTTTIVTIDTIGQDAEGQPILRENSKYGTINEGFKTGLDAFRSYNMSISANTQLFATKTFKKGWLRGIRHIMKPTVSFNYTPDTYNRYIEYVDSDTRPEENQPQTYNPFSGGVFSAPLSGKSASINFGIQNVFEAKYRGKNDTIDKKLKLFDNIAINGGYNLVADSLNWSDISLTTNTQFFKGVTTLSFRSSFTPYVLKNGNTRTNETLWSKEKKLIQLNTLSTGVSTGFSLKQIRDWIKGDPEKNNAKIDKELVGGFSQKIGDQGGNSFPEIPIDTISNKTNPNELDKTEKQLPTLFSLFENFRISHNFNFGVRRPVGKGYSRSHCQQFANSRQSQAYRQLEH